MCPSWTRIADEIESLARDRALAASVEPDPAEQVMLERESGLLWSAASFARSGPGDGCLVHSACEGVVVHCNDLVMWGISHDGEQGLRALASEPLINAEQISPCRLLRVVLGMPYEPVGRAASVAA